MLDKKAEKRLKMLRKSGPKMSDFYPFPYPKPKKMPLRLRVYIRYLSNFGFDIKRYIDNR